MVTIPFSMPDFTLDALNRAREDEQYKEKRRQYLGAIYDWRSVHSQNLVRI